MRRTAYSLRFVPVLIAAALFVPRVAWAQLREINDDGIMRVPYPEDFSKPGMIVLEDGSPPPAPVTIYGTQCGGDEGVPIGRTDSKGYFTRGNGGSVQGAGRGGSGPIARSGGSVPYSCFEARLDGYRSSPVSRERGRDLPTIVLHAILGVEGLTTSVTSLAAPKNAREAFWKAEEAIENKQWDKARPELEKAVKIYPKYALAWFERGRVHQNSGDVAHARSAYEQAVQADPKFIKPYLELTKIYNQEQNWRATADVTAAVIKLDASRSPAIYVFNAQSNFRLGNMEAAEASAREAIRLDRGHVYPEAQYTLGVILGARGDYKGAAEHLRYYLLLAPTSPNAETVKKQLARAEELAAAWPAGGQAAPRQPSP